MLYILYGSDSFSRSEALRALKRELDVDGSLESNTAEFEAGQAAPAEVIAACDTVPFLGGRRLVLVEGALSKTPTSGGGRRGRRAPAEDESGTVARGPWWALVEYAGRMPETTTLVLVDGGSVDEALLDELKPFATVVGFALPGPREVTGWVQARARARGVEIDGRACSTIAELVGNDTGIIASEIEKLLMYAAGERITENDVKALVPDIRDREGYLLADAVADGKAAQATKLLHEMLRKGKHHPGALLATIENRYRRLAVAREMINAGATGTQIGSNLRMSGYGLERLHEQASRVSMERVSWALDRIAQSDQDVKEGRLDERLSLELLVQDLASEASRVSRSQRVSAAAGSS
jgi:DNA polymerase-3 subunit delta